MSLKGRCRQVIRWILVDCGFARIVRSQILQTAVAPVSLGYLLVLDVWGASWPWVLNYREYHQDAFLVVILSAIAIGFFRALGDWLAPSTPDPSYSTTLEHLLVAVGRIIEAKTQRFHYRLRQGLPKSNVFKSITHPADQMKVIVNEARDFFLTTIPSLSKDHFDITVTCKDRNGIWIYLVKVPDDWTQPEPHDLVKPMNSTIRRCIDTGEKQFHADKIAAERNNEYTPGKRDQRNKRIGSICCIPIVLKDFIVLGRQNICVVSFSTYGVQFCDEYDAKARSAVIFVCEEFSQRIKLEYMLYLVREQSETASQRGSRK